MKIVTAAQMRNIDEQTSAQFGISSGQLMERAGQAVADIARNTYSPARVCILCGKGNNAGDGFVAARWLKANAIDVDVVLYADPSSLRGAAAEAYEKMLAAEIVPLPPASLQSCFLRDDLVFDALLGTGIRGPVTGELASAIEAINGSRLPVVAVDVPSGVRELSPGEDPGPMVHADLTVTIGLPKLPLLEPPGVLYAGRIVPASINFPKELIESEEITLNWAPTAELATWIPRRPPVSHKGTFGSVGLVAGSAPYAGAAILAARAALRSGCGLVFIFTTAELNPIFKAALPEAVTRIVPARTGQWLDNTGTSEILKTAATMDVLAVGPGIGVGRDQAEMIGAILGGFDRPIVLDADALTCLTLPASAEGTEPPRLDALRGRRNVVVTPHPGEMARMAGFSTQEVQARRIDVARGFADAYGVNVLLKGASTVIALAGGQTYINPGATSALAKGGTGDVLTGLIVGLIAQGMEPGKAAILGAHVHLEAARLCAGRTGERGVLAGEVSDAISPVMGEMERSVR